MKKVMMMAAAAGVVAALDSHSVDAAATITFDNLIPTSPIDPCFGPPGVCPIEFLDTDGLRFSVPGADPVYNHAHLVSSPFEAPGTFPQLQRYASNGTQYIGLDSRDIAMAPVGGGVFSLLSVDAAEGLRLAANSNSPFNPVGFASQLQVEGSLFGGGTVVTTFLFDGINDGPGGQADFQTFLLPATFRGLTSVTFRSLDAGGNFVGADGVFSIDNVVVPEPGVGLVLGLGLAGGIALRRRKRSRV